MVSPAVDGVSEGSTAVPRGLQVALGGAGSFGRLLGSHPWSSTPLGPMGTWPEALRSAASICVSSRFPIVLFCGQDLLLFYNEAYVPFLGVKHPGALGRPARDVWAELWPVIGTMLRGVLDDSEATWSEDLELNLTRRGFAEEAYFTFSYSPIVESDGQTSAVFCAVTDTTDAVLSQRRWKLLQALAGASSSNPNPRQTARAALETLRADAADVPAAAILLTDEEGRPQIVPGSDGSVVPEGVEAHEIRRVLADGSSPVVFVPAASSTDGRPARFAIGPLGQGENGRALGAMVLGLSPRLGLDAPYRSFLERVLAQVSTALNEARVLEAERARAEALAELDKAKSAFLANVSHELRTPLTLLLAPLEDVIGDGGVGPAQRRQLELAHRNANRLLRLVNNLLAFSRLEAGRPDATFVPLDVAAVTADLASSFRTVVETAGLHFLVHTATLREPVWLDPPSWESVVLNLLSNAFKFTLTGSIEVDVGEEEGSPYLRVTDTGSGIRPELLPRVFERFHHATNNDARTYEGTGIGLALCQDLVALHGGTIEVQSEVGVGSSFTVRMLYGKEHLPPDRLGEPFDSPSPLTAYAEEAAGWLISSVPNAQLPGDTRLRILVVDDNADMRAYLERLLSASWTVLCAPDGYAALEVLRSDSVDLVVTDVMMPRMDGFSLIAAMRADGRLHEIPVLMLTARAGPEAAVEGLDGGADDYVAKPFAASELLARVRTNLELAASRRHSARQRTLTRLLARAGESLVGTTDPDEVLNVVIDLVVPELAEWACLHVLEGKELMPVIAGAEREEHRRALERLTARYPPRLGDPTGPGAVVTSGRVEVLDRISSVVLGARAHGDDGGEQDGEAEGEVEGEQAGVEDGELLAAAGPRCATVVPLTGRDKPLGTLSLVRTRKEPFSPAEVEFLEEIGRRAGRGLESALLYEQERDIAWTLQHQLLPKALPELAGLRTSAVYEPGTAGAEIGGDWYDVIDLGDQRAAVCVGDVVGHGPEAAAAMGQLRVALRAHALEGHVPGVVVARLSELTNDLGVPLVTLCYSEIQLTEGIVVSVCAGHPPPLVVTDDRAEFLRLPADPALGACPDWRYRERTTVLEPRSCLLYYTDGLVESRLAGLDEGLERLRRAARDSPLVPGILVDSVLAAMRPSMGGLDDTVVCAVRPELEEGHRTRSATRLVSGHLASVGSIRHWARSVVGSWGHDRSIRDALELLLSELVTNAITYSAGTVRVSLQSHPDAIEVAVSDRSPRPPRFQNPTPSTEFGRGLQIVHRLSSSVDIVEEEGFGKTIRCRIELGPGPRGASAAASASGATNR